MKKFLLCMPDNFAVNYEINDWMNSKIGRVDNAEARNQWQNLYNALDSSGNQVELITNQPEHVPDLVFTANAGLVLENYVLLTHFACRERQPEEAMYGAKFKDLGMVVDNSCIDENVFFEGAGDALFHKLSKTLVLAYGFRTEEKALELVSRFVKGIDSEIEVLQVELSSGSFYHLDTCFCPLDNNEILWYPEAFSMKSQQLMRDAFGDMLIAVDKEDAYNFACNAVSVGQQIFMNKISDELKLRLTQSDLTVIEIDLHQFLLSGGSAKCLTLELPQTNSINVSNE